MTLSRFSDGTALLAAWMARALSGTSAFKASAVARNRKIPKGETPYLATMTRSLRKALFSAWFPADRATGTKGAFNA